MTRVEHLPSVEGDIRAIESSPKVDPAVFRRELARAIKQVERHPVNSKDLDLVRLRSQFKTDEEWEEYLRRYIPGGIQGNIIGLFSVWKHRFHHRPPTHDDKGSLRMVYEFYPEEDRAVIIAVGWRNPGKPNDVYVIAAARLLSQLQEAGATDEEE